MDRVVVEDGASVQDSIVGRYVKVASSLGRPTWVTGLSVVGDDVEVGEGSMLTATKVDPHKTVPQRVVLQGQYLQQDLQGRSP
jgi:NDP-sugar pyrophosphorylase family protein